MGAPNPEIHEKVKSMPREELEELAALYLEADFRGNKRYRKLSFGVHLTGEESERFLDVFAKGGWSTPRLMILDMINAYFSGADRQFRSFGKGGRTAVMTFPYYDNWCWINWWGWALRPDGVSWSDKSHTHADSLKALLMLSAMHPERTKAELVAIKRYCSAEDLDPYEYMAATILGTSNGPNPLDGATRSLQAEAARLAAWANDNAEDNKTDEDVEDGDEWKDA